jgi:hypothetical protein
MLELAWQINAHDAQGGWVVDMNDAGHLAQAAAGMGGAAMKHTAIAAGGGLTLGAIVVMSLTMPSKKIDFFSALISTVISSLAGGAYAVQKLGLLDAVVASPTMTHLYIALAQVGGMFFVCGLPGWILVRGFFVWSEARKNKGIDVIIGDARSMWK